MEVKQPLSIVLCKDSPYNLMNVLGLFSVILQPRNFHNVKIINTFSASKTASKVTKILQSFGYSLEFESFKSAKYSWCYEVCKVRTFSASPGTIFISIASKSCTRTEHEILISKRAAFRHSSNSKILKISDCTKQIFTFELVFD